MHCIPTTYVPEVPIYNEEREMESVSTTNREMAPSSIVSIIAGAIMILGGLLPLSMMGIFTQQTGIITLPGYGGMMGGGVVGGVGGIMSGMMGGSTVAWAAVGIISGVSAGLGAILVVGGYSIQRKPESANGWGVAILVTSIVGLLTMTGFFIGPILGIIGGILALSTRRP